MATLNSGMILALGAGEYLLNQIDPIIRLKLLILFLFVSVQLTFAAKVDTLMVYSPSMDKWVDNIVIIPNDHLTRTEGFETLYLLHGAYGNFLDWPTKVPELEEYADRYELIIVCPDGGFNSWYFDSPVDEKMQYETYISKELVNAIDVNYNTKRNREGRAITGLSMGGHGAFYLAIKHPDLWGAAGSMSGGLDFRPFPDDWDISKRLGTYKENKKVWDSNAVINMLDLLPDADLKLIMDCGTEDFFYKANVSVHKELLKRGIPHDYTARPGNHDWDYWVVSLENQIAFFDKFFKSNKVVEVEQD